MITGHNITLTGHHNSPIIISGGRGVNFFGFSTNHPVRLEDCRDVTIQQSEFLGSLTGFNIQGMHVSDTTFDAQGLDVDACMIGGARQKIKARSYLDAYWEKKQTFSTSLLRYGKPDSFYTDNCQWHKTVSHRTGQEIWKGIDHKDLSRDISFQNCTFRNSKRAGLFVHHSDNLRVENCSASNTLDYGIGGEWLRQSVFKGNVCDQIVTHYYNIGCLIEGNILKSLTINSQGDPVKDVIIRGNTVLADGWERGRIMIRNGQFFDYSSAGWAENVDIIGNTCKFIVLNSGLVKGEPPEVMLKDISITNNDIQWSKDNYFDAIRLESVDGVLIRDNEMNGGSVRDFDRGNRVTSRMIEPPSLR